MAAYLVTGGAGFIGSHLATALVARGDRAIVLDDLSTGSRDNLAGLEVGTPSSGAPVELHIGSITDPAAVALACRGVEGVFHEAAQVSVPQSIEDPVRSYEINVIGTLRVLEGARKAGVRRVVFAASSAAYGDSSELPAREDFHPSPLSPYASGKLAGEHLMAVYGRAFGMRTVSLRYFNVFGPRQADDSPYTGVIAIFAKALLSGRAPTIYGDGEQTRDFTFIDNVVEANLKAMEADLEPGIVLNIGTEQSVSVNELFRAMRDELGLSIEPRHAPPRKGDVLHSRASCVRARTLLGYRGTTGWRSGLRPTLGWYRGRSSSPSASF